MSAMLKQSQRPNGNAFPNGGRVFQPAIGLARYSCVFRSHAQCGIIRRLNVVVSHTKAAMIKLDEKDSSGNVFADIGAKNPEQALAKAELARQIAGIIKARGLTQIQAAEILQIDQAKVSALTRGHLGGFSADRLFRFLNALGHDIEIRVKTKPKSRKNAQVRVFTA